MDRQPSQNANSSSLEDKLRDMILTAAAAPDITPPSGSAIPPRSENQAGGNSHLAPQQPLQPPLLHQQSNPYHGRQSARGRGRSQNGSTIQPQNVVSRNNNNNRRGDAQRGRSQHSQRGFGARGAPSGFASAPGHQQPSMDQFRAQWQYLEETAMQEMSRLEMSQEEIEYKDRFRAHLEQVLQEVVHYAYPYNPPKIGLACFGSVASGFGMPGSDMDLALVSTAASHDIFRLFEKHLLDIGHGAHLLSRTRVPILKVCEIPTPELLCALRAERQKWDDMTAEQREKFDHPARPDAEQTVPIQSTKQEGQGQGSSGPQIATGGALDKQNGLSSTQNNNIARETSNKLNSTSTKLNQDKETEPNATQPPATALPFTKSEVNHRENGGPVTGQGRSPKLSLDRVIEPQNGVVHEEPDKERSQTTQRQPPPRTKREWYREKKLGPLDFPKDGVGIQCDINFANPLGLHNTLLLRCYSHCDPRVRLMVLFVKAWASRRKINSARNGTLSSYGYVLMVLHFLVNVAKPPVCPNLQLMRKSHNPLQHGDPNSICDGWDVRFWRNEAEIQSLASKGMMSHNREPIGILLRNFFQYYAQSGHLGNGVVGFAWTQDVLSLRTDGGILSKQMKGWTGAKVTIQDNVEVRHRYLFAIEDPFELDHNVARPVTHNGIVAIRDEFRRAWRIIGQVGRGQLPEGLLLEPLISQEPSVGEKEEPVDTPQVHEQSDTNFVKNAVDNLHISQAPPSHMPPDGEVHTSAGLS